MELKKMQIKMLSCCFLAGGLTLAGCSTDDSIDVGDVDTTIGIGTDGFSIPAGHSDSISLINLFKIEDSDCIDTIQGGDYQFFKKGDDIDATNVKIDPVSIDLNNENIQSIEFTIPIVSQYTNGSRSIRNSRRASSDITFEQSISTFDFTESNLTGSIRQLVKAEIVPVPFTLKETFSNSLKEILTQFKGISLELPNYFDIENNKIEIRNGGEWKKVDIVDGKISLDGIQTSAPLELKGNIVAVDFSKPSKISNDGKKQILKFNASTDYSKDLSKVIINGFVFINIVYNENNLTFDTSDLAAIASKLSGKTDDDFKIYSSFKLGSGSQPKMEFSDVTGRFYPSIDLTIDPVKIDDIPDFLTEDDVEIDLNDILMTLGVNSTLPIVGKVNAKLTPYINNVAKPSISVNNIKINSNSKSKVLISRKDNSSLSGYTDYHWNGDSDGSGDIGNLLTNIPDKIEFSCEASADSDNVYKIFLNRDYTIKPEYDIKAPLALKGKSCIVYDDSADGWNKDLNDNDIDLNGDSYLMVEGDIINNTPLDLIFDAPTPLGLNGKGISAVAVQILNQNNEDVKSTEVLSGQTSKLRLKITTTDNGLKELDGIKYAVKAKAASSGKIETLNGRKHTIQIKNMVGSLKGKVTFNPDKKDDKKK